MPTITPWGARRALRIALEVRSRTCTVERARAWGQVFAIGVAVGSFGFTLEHGVTWLRELKTIARQSDFARTYFGEDVATLCIGACCAMVAALLVAFGAPYAAGSGIPELKTLLNGARLPAATMSARTLVVKLLATVCVAASGLPLGREGPAVFIGSSIGALALHWWPVDSTTWRATTPLRDLGGERTSHLESRAALLRALVSIGGAAGFAVAFRAPVGGVLFIFEDIATFWGRETTFRAFVCASVSVLFTQILKIFWTVFTSAEDDESYLEHTYFAYSTFVVYNRGESIASLRWKYIDVLPFAALAALAGIVAALFTSAAIAIHGARLRAYSRGRALCTAPLSASSACVHAPLWMCCALRDRTIRAAAHPTLPAAGVFVPLPSLSTSAKHRRAASINGAGHLSLCRRTTRFLRIMVCCCGDDATAAGAASRHARARRSSARGKAQPKTASSVSARSAVQQIKVAYVSEACTLAFVVLLLFSLLPWLVGVAVVSTTGGTRATVTFDGIVTLRSRSSARFHEALPIHVPAAKGSGDVQPTATVDDAPSSPGEEERHSKGVVLLPDTLAEAATTDSARRRRRLHELSPATMSQLRELVSEHTTDGEANYFAEQASALAQRPKLRSGVTWDDAHTIGVPGMDGVGADAASGTSSRAEGGSTESGSTVQSALAAVLRTFPNAAILQSEGFASYVDALVVWFRDATERVAKIGIEHRCQPLPEIPAVVVGDDENIVNTMAISEHVAHVRTHFRGRCPEGEFDELATLLPPFATFESALTHLFARDTAGGRFTLLSLSVFVAA